MSADGRRRTPLMHGMAAALLVGTTPLARAFARDVANVRGAQERVLRSITRDLTRTAYGRSLGIRGNEPYESFAAKVPIVEYEALAPWIEREMQGDARAIAPDRVVFYEKTSGSSGAVKHIPYTPALLRSFTRMFLLWARDLLRHGPRLSTGISYFSVSPALPTQESASGVPVGLADDSDYLGRTLKPLFSPFFPVPSSLKRIRDPEKFRYALALCLLAAEELEIVSVWSPSFFTMILDTVDAHRDALASDLRRRDVVIEGVRLRLPRTSPERIRHVSRAPHAELWPSLRILSCWRSASAAPLSRALESRFPGVLVQGKGLLATEAPITFPLLTAGNHYVPMLGEIFLEFADGPDVRPLWDLSMGGEYTVILSQRGGLVRYRLGDRVRVGKRYRGAPCLEFLGREEAVVDLVGEKLNERFVEEALFGLGLAPDAFRIVVPREASEGRGAHYVLVIERGAAIARPSSLARDLDEALSRAHHYGLARTLGQLGPAVVLETTNARERLCSVLVARGMKRGDIKDRALLTRIEDARALLAQI